MFVLGISRFDAGAEGIHLAWNVSDVLAVSSPGFDIQRRIARSGTKYQCISLTSKEFNQLQSSHELETSLGSILYRRAGPLQPLLPSAASTPWPSAGAQVDVFTLELAAPTDSVRISGKIAATAGIEPFAIFSVALSQGKALASATAQGDGVALTLNGNQIDTVVIYTVSPIELTICIAPAESVLNLGWESVPYLVRGLTLPIREANPALTNGTAEWNAAKKRLVTGDIFAQANFDDLVPSLRLAISGTTLGRPGERILLGRTTLDDPYQEIAFADQLSLLQIHPCLRRVLGFGYFDPQSSGLVAGQSYEYRVTGHFNAPDLTGGIYDFHTIPSQTILPAAFYSGDLRVSSENPVSVVLDPSAPAGSLNAASRRGIQIASRSILPGWLGPLLEDWAVILDLPRPTSSVTFETDASQKLLYAAGDPWSFGASRTPLPPGNVVKLSFVTPVSQIRLAGDGILFAIRVPSPTVTSVQSLAVTTPPVLFAKQPLPAAPLSLTISNLQTPPGPSLMTLQDATQGAQRPLPGFELTWLPATANNVSLWPSGTGTAPPIDAIIFQIEHREVTLPSTYGPWDPILPGDNVALGTRDNRPELAPLQFAANLADVFPVHRPRSAAAGYVFRLSDVFDIDDTSAVFQRPIPAFGTYHQYRIRAMDTVGRVSTDWTLSNVARFEKHNPPPLPVGPQPEPTLITNVDGMTQMSSPPGVKARALVQNDPALTASDLAVLGTHRSAIVLSWGWREAERTIDGSAREFRVYYWLNTPDVIPGTITSVTAASGGWNLGFQTERVLQDGECVGQWITSGGYPFRIAALTGGASISIHVETALANPAALPAIGPANFGRPLNSAHQRPASWDKRVAVVPLTVADSYQYIFYDLFNLSPNHPLDSIWVGVAAADGEFYVDDELLPAVTNGGRPGNESSIVTCAVAGRDHTRPVFSLPPPLGDVPELVTEEPSGRQVLVSLDLIALFPGTLTAGTPVALDRCPIDTIFGITSLNSSGQVQLAMKDGTQQLITFPNPADEASVVADLQGTHPERMATRYWLYLAAHHARPNEIFTRVSADILPFGTVQDRLAPKPARFFYRVRQADALGRVSADGAIAPVVVRVPSIAPAVAPVKVALNATASSVAITLRVPSDAQLSHLLLFSMMLPVSSPFTDLSGAELLRVPNRRDLYPLNGIRLRAPISGQLLIPVAKSLTDVDVVTDAGGSSATISVPGTFGNYVILWACALSIDGIPSRLSGPFTWGVPKP